MNGEILEFTYRPRANKKRVFPLFFTLLALSGVLMILSVQLERFKGVVSLGGLVGITVCMYLYLKYMSASLVYSVMIDSNKEAVFLVNKVVGKRSSLMYSSYISNIESIQKFTKETKKDYKPSRNAKKFNFSVTYGCEEFYVMKEKSRLGDFEVVLECTDAVAQRLLEYSEIAKAKADEE